MVDKCLLQIKSSAEWILRTYSQVAMKKIREIAPEQRSEGGAVLFLTPKTVPVPTGTKAR